MKKLVGVIALFGILLNFKTLPNFVYANENNNSIISQIEINNEQNFANLSGISEFASFDDKIYFVSNSILNKYDMLTKKVETLAYNNVSNLKQANNKLFFINDENIIALNSDGTIFEFEPTPIQATKFNVYFQDNSTTLSYIYENNLGIINFDESGKNNYSHINNINLPNILTLAVNYDYTYIVYKDGDQNNFIRYNNNRDYDTLEYPFVYLGCTNLELIPNSNTFLLTHNDKSSLTILTELNNELVSQKLISVRGSTTPSFALGDISEFTDVKYLNNRILIANNRTNSNIQSFKLENNSLVPEKIVLASSSYELGRFYNASNIEILNKNTFYVSDTQNKRIQIVNNNISTSLTNLAETKFENPKKIITTNNINFYVLDNNKLYCSQLDGNDFYKYNVENVLDIAVSNNNELYYVENNGIYKCSYADKQPTQFLAHTFVKSKIEIYNNFLVVSNNNELNIYSILNSEAIFTTTFENDIKDISCDYFGNFYILTNNGITPIMFDEQTISYKQETNLDINYNFNNISCFDVDKVDGTIICFDNSIQVLIKIQTNFIKTLKDFVPPVNTQEKLALSSLLPYGKVINECYVFDYPYNTNCSIKLESDNYVYVLDSQTYSDYYYVLYNNNNIINFGFVKKNCLELSSYNTNNSTQIEVIYKNVKVYKYPTILKDCDNNDFLIKNLNQNDVLTCINKNIISLDNSKYYAVLLENNNIGYVNASDVRDYNTDVIKSLPDPNAKLISNTDIINLYSEESLQSTVVYELTKNCRVYVETFNEKQPFTKVVYVDNNKIAHVGYIETKYILMEKNNVHLTSAFVLLGVGITLIIAGIIVYYKYKKSKLK